MPTVAVIGAGVIGLSTAIKVQEAGHDVTIIAKDLPGDPKSIHYTSPWAGAHHVTGAGEDKRQQKMDDETFKTMWDMSLGDAEGCFMKVNQSEYYYEARSMYNHLEVMPDFKHLPPQELRAGSHSGVNFTTLNIDTAVYVPYLLSRFLAKGGHIVRASIQHISQVADGAFSTKPDAMVICAGLGAKSLGGVEDQDMYPVRGQIVLIRAPWIKFGRTLSSLDGRWTYIIPRRSGDVILGGSKVDNDWFPKPIPSITKSILERCLELCPELVPPHLIIDGEKPTISHLESLIIEEGCGLRPARKGGIRLETGKVKDRSDKEVPVIHNYGHGGSGFQSSWGSASIALELLTEALGQ